MALVAFDFDGTLTDDEMTVLLGEQCGVADRMATITDRAMRDEIDYAESLRERCRLLAGLSVDDAQAAFDRVTLRPGAAALLTDLRNGGVRTAILTGGFERGVRTALETEGVVVDDVIANRLPSESDRLTGAVTGPLIEGTKDDALASVAADHDVALADTVAVGDGANDLPMLEAAGLSIGYAPKPGVAPACDVVVTTMAALRAVLTDERVL